MAFVAINYITCTAEYRGRFEELFATRARAIDRMPGFISFELLKPVDSDDGAVSHCVALGKAGGFRALDKL